jgi:hypothetical protein
MILESVISLLLAFVVTYRLFLVVYSFTILQLTPDRFGEREKLISSEEYNKWCCIVLRLL